MSANLSPQTTVIKDWLVNAAKQLSMIGISSARLDSEIILAHAFKQNRTYLHSHNNELINENDLKTVNKLLNQRLNRVPIAYIIGEKEFYGRKFIVNPDVLIPRPESEDIITILKTIVHNKKSTLRLVDVGTGCGCLGITAKIEFPKLNVTLSDIDSKTLNIAKQNTERFSVELAITQGDLLKNLSARTDIIITNLPYVDKKWERSPETNFEPDIALFAENQGLSLIKSIINQSDKVLNPDGYLIIEADPIQHKSIINYALKRQLKKVSKLGYIISFIKI